MPSCNCPLLARAAVSTRHHRQARNALQHVLVGCLGEPKELGFGAASCSKSQLISTSCSAGVDLALRLLHRSTACFRPSLPPPCLHSTCVALVGSRSTHPAKSASLLGSAKGYINPSSLFPLGRSSFREVRFDKTARWSMRPPKASVPSAACHTTRTHQQNGAHAGLLERKNSSVHLHRFCVPAARDTQHTEADFSNPYRRQQHQSSRISPQSFHILQRQQLPRNPQLNAACSHMFRRYRQIRIGFHFGAHRLLRLNYLLKLKTPHP